VRYYSVSITKTNGQPYLFKSLGGLALTSLLPTGPQNPISGQANPAALNIEFDISAVALNDPDNNAWARVWGLGLQDIGNASDLNGLDISISAGMSKGLPLANPAQAGLIMQGQILQAYGNWIGTAQTVDMTFVAGTNQGSPSQPANFPFSWPAGTPLATAIQQTLNIAMPGVAQQINISPKLVLNYAVTGWYQSAQQFADFINEISSTIIGGNYAGVTISTNGQTVRAFDGAGTTASGAKAIAFTDLIGQPTWIDGGVVSAKTVLRADIHQGDTVTLPQTLFNVGSVPAAQFLSGSGQQLISDKLTFSGNFLVSQVHHYGNFRQADADSWATVFQLGAISSNTPTAPMAA
jgi:hypothetical protein